MTNNTLHKINETLGELIDELDDISWSTDFGAGKQAGLRRAKLLIEQYLFNEREEGGENVD
jgi:hypothetical protein